MIFFGEKLQKWLSYLWPFTLKSWHSAYSGRIDLILINGKKVLNTQHANYSFDSLHRVFQQVFQKYMPILKSDEKILLLGLGGGSVPFILRNEMKILNPITAIEIDPLMVEIAKEEFGIHLIENITIIVADAVAWIQNCIEQFACIVVDVFIDDQVPEAILSAEFLMELKRVLKPGGRVFLNTIERNLKKEWMKSNLYQRLKTIGFKVQMESVYDVNIVWIADV